MRNNTICGWIRKRCGWFCACVVMLILAGCDASIGGGGGKGGNGGGGGPPIRLDIGQAADVVIGQFLSRRASRIKGRLYRSPIRSVIQSGVLPFQEFSTYRMLATIASWVSTLYLAETEQRRTSRWASWTFLPPILASSIFLLTYRNSETQPMPGLRETSCSWPTPATIGSLSGTRSLLTMSPPMSSWDSSILFR
jgi:hypothetical protein